MQLRLIAWSLVAALLSAATVALAAGRDGPHRRLDEAPPWVHKVPEFVCDRVDLVSGLTGSQPSSGVRFGGRTRHARKQIPDPARKDSICASAANGRPDDWLGFDTFGAKGSSRNPSTRSAGEVITAPA